MSGAVLRTFGSLRVGRWSTLRPRVAVVVPSTRRVLSSSFDARPSPLRLPAEEQAEFERLQREAEAALSSHTTITASQASPPSSEAVSADGSTMAAGSLAGGIRQGAPPEFEGDVNPRTGEVGGPKNEPLRWGSEGDWSYNGKVTDF
jgi:hypothetical protein